MNLNIDRIGSLPHEMQIVQIIRFFPSRIRNCVSKAQMPIRIPKSRNVPEIWALDPKRNNK